jgi:hypothetical protein
MDTFVQLDLGVINNSAFKWQVLRSRPIMHFGKGWEAGRCMEDDNHALLNFVEQPSSNVERYRKFLDR